MNCKDSGNVGKFVVSGFTTWAFTTKAHRNKSFNLDTRFTFPCCTPSHKIQGTHSRLSNLIFPLRSLKRPAHHYQIITFPNFQIGSPFPNDHISKFPNWLPHFQIFKFSIFQIGLQVSPRCLLTLNGFEECFKISLSKAFGTLSLYNFKKQSRSVFDWF